MILGSPEWPKGNEIFYNHLQHCWLNWTVPFAHSQKLVGPHTRPGPHEVSLHGSQSSLPTETKIIQIQNLKLNKHLEAVCTNI